MNQKLYICNTYYHLFIAIVYTLTTKNNNSVVISADNKNNKLVKNKELIKRIINSKIFKNVIIFDHSIEELKIKEKKFSSVHRLFFTHKIIKKNNINFKEYNEICIFYDNCLIGRILNKLKIRYTLLEDGQDCFKSKNKNRIYKKNNIKKIIKYLLNYRELGKSKYVDKIVVNDKNDLCIKNKTIVEEPKNDLLKKLTNEDKKRIFTIFINKKDFSYLNECNLIITQPLYDDKLIKSIEEQINMYKTIIENYTDKKNIVIKTHPRETIDYKKYFKDYEIISEPFPLEIITFLDTIKIKKVITVSSTSVYSFKNGREILMLGWNWLNDYKNSNLR